MLLLIGCNGSLGVCAGVSTCISILITSHDHDLTDITRFRKLEFDQYVTSFDPSEFEPWHPILEISNNSQPQK